MTDKRSARYEAAKKAPHGVPVGRSFWQRRRCGGGGGGQPRDPAATRLLRVIQIELGDVHHSLLALGRHRARGVWLEGCTVQWRCQRQSSWAAGSTATSRWKCRERRRLLTCDNRHAAAAATSLPHAWLQAQSCNTPHSLHDDRDEIILEFDNRPIRCRCHAC